MFNTWTSLALSDAILAFSSSFCIFLLSQCYQRTDNRLPVTGAIIAFVLVALSSSLTALNHGFSTLWAQPSMMMIAAAQTLAPPMLAGASAALCWKLAWSQPTWWRIIIGLMLGYQLASQAGLLAPYIYTTTSLSLGGMLTTALAIYQQKRVSSLFMVTAVTTYLLAALVTGTTDQLAGHLQMNLCRYLLALANLFAASSLFILLKYQSRTNP